MRVASPVTCESDSGGSMTPDRVAGVVLAAGQSTRMGTNKMLLDLGGRTLVRRAAGTALSAGLDPVLVVVGHESGRVEAELSDLACVPVHNPEYASGMNTSLRSGIFALPEDVAGAIVLLGDMPLVDAPMLRALVTAFRSSGAPLAVSVFGEVVAPPILYGRELFPELRALTAQACGKSVIQKHRGEAAELAWPPEILTDLDSPVDVQRIRARLEAA
jgi:molybdenum cofactor cytidylyltransferase